jgi:hypothetical protein
MAWCQSLRNWGQTGISGYFLLRLSAPCASALSLARGARHAARRRHHGLIRVGAGLEKRVCFAYPPEYQEIVYLRTENSEGIVVAASEFDLEKNLRILENL